MEFVTAKKGTPHFTSEHFRSILTAICGTGTYVADLYDKLEPELAANNVIKIHSGCLLHHGGVFWVKTGTYDEVTYQNGTQGMQRIDLVVGRYTKDAETGIENGEWVVIQGTPAESDPVAPDYTAGDMQEGDLIDDCPLFEIYFDGINVVEIKKLVEETTNIDEMKKEITQLNSKIGVVYQNSRADIQMPSKTSTTLKSLTLPAGTYIVCASYCFSESFSEVCSLEVFNGQLSFVPTVRGTGMYGGGLAVSFVYKSTEEATLTMSAWQGSANTVMAQSIQFDAVRIK